MLDESIRKSISECVLCWLATVNAKGEPNVSPKEMFVAHSDDSLLIANIASPASVANIRENPAVCVSFIDIFTQKGFKLRGRASIVEASDERFDSMLQAFHQLGGEGFPVKSIIEVAVETSEPIIAPSYWLFPDTAEQDQVDQAMASYGVRPKE